MADGGVRLFFLFDKDGCVFQPVSLSAKIQRAIPVEKHNHPYQTEKIDVPHHQP